MKLSLTNSAHRFREVSSSSTRSSGCNSIPNRNFAITAIRRIRRASRSQGSWPVSVCIADVDGRGAERYSAVRCALMSTLAAFGCWRLHAHSILLYPITGTNRPLYNTNAVFRVRPHSFLVTLRNAPVRPTILPVECHIMSDHNSEVLHYYGALDACVSVQYRTYLPSYRTASCVWFFAR